MYTTSDYLSTIGAAFAAAAAGSAAARIAAQRGREAAGGMSCLRLAGLSEGEVEFLAWASPAQRWLATLALASRELARRSGMTEESPVYQREPYIPKRALYTEESPIYRREPYIPPANPTP